MRNKPIWVALAAGTALIVFALVVGSRDDQTGDGELVVVTRAPQRTFLPVADTNNNGIPDWQEALVRTEPLAALSNATTTDWEPSSLTEVFGVSFIENYLRNKTYGSLGRDQESFVALSAEVLAERATDQPITAAELRISDQNNQESLRTYGNVIATMLNKYPASEQSEMEILEKALRSNNPQELAALQPIINSYQGMIVDMKLIEVPSTYTREHLALTNAFRAVAGDIHAASLTFDDPMYTLVRIQQYQTNVNGMAEAFLSLFNKLVVADRVPFGPNDELYVLLPRSL